MDHPSPLTVEIDGRAAAADALASRALVNYGHFTAMQVRGRATRGLDLHLERLDAATRELYGVGLDPDVVRDHVRHALTGTVDASVRVDVFWPAGKSRPSVMVTVRPPAPAPQAPKRLRSVRYQRPLPHVKHVGTFGLIHHGLLAERAGFDDALLTDPDGLVCESGMANVGFLDGATVVWPDAPMLHGITMRLVERGLAARGVVSTRRAVRLDDLPAFDGGFLTNSLGVVPLAQVDDQALPVDDGRVAALAEIYEAEPWTPV